MLLKTNMMIVFAGYRDWSLNILQDLKRVFTDYIFVHCDTPEKLDNALKQANPDVVILAGWSWILDKEVVSNHFTIGLHPSDLPAYAGGSPIQHQILDGVLKSKVSVFHVTPQLDQGPTLAQGEFSLEGNMSDILLDISNVGGEVFCRILNDLEGYKEVASKKREEKPVKPFIRKRLAPKDSCLTKEDLSRLSSKSLYDIIRARGAPYPNVYLEDAEGRLYFEQVRFEEK